MPLYILKPVVWNSNGYLKPAGEKFRSGYPKQNGFGHEEWNAAPHWEYVEDGQRWRCFHTEPPKEDRTPEFAGDVVVLMIASFRGGQYVVGVAGNATCLVDNLPERRRLAKLLGTSRVERANEAWAVGQVRKAFGDDRETFMEKWNREAPWGPSWRCPADSFLWLDRPVLLHPEKIRGKSRLVTMYSSSQTIERHQAQSILMSIVNSGYQHQALDRIGMICAADVSEVDDDIDAIRRRSRRALGPTSKQQLVDARRGQGRFRRDLERHWSGCAVTGCTLNEVLRASHIRPWRSSTDEERLDAANGLLLVANLDALFDCGRISFADDGQLLLSPVLTEVHLAQLGITRHSRLSRPLNAAARGYLASHRKLYSYQD